MEHERSFNQARDARGIGRMPDVAFNGADIAELLFIRLAFKNTSQRLEFYGVADGVPVPCASM